MVIAIPAEKALHLVQRILSCHRALTFMVSSSHPRGAEATGVDNPRMVGKMFGDQILVREVMAQAVDDQFQMLAIDLGRDIEPEAIGVILLKIHSGILIEKVLDLLFPPGRA